jgi:adenylate cyclase
LSVTLNFVRYVTAQRMTRILERTVLFADLRGSTSLYESLGNARATEVVTQSVAMLSRTVQRCDGTVVKTLGDGLMSVFDHPRQAVQAADDMHESLALIVANGRSVDPALAGRFPTLKLQVALARGEVVEMSGDCFGDAVNVAARLLDHAGDNETLATASVLDALRDSERMRFRNINRIQLRGRVEPVQVHLLEAQRSGDTVVTQYGDVSTGGEPEAIRLVCMDLNRVFAGPRLPVVLGRSPQATYCIDDSRVSRSHARIDWHGGTFQLSDLSYNGTYVRFAHDEETLSLRRGTCTLHGSGVIALGAPLTDPLAACVRFEVLRFAETLPLQPEF